MQLLLTKAICSINVKQVREIKLLLYVMYGDQVHHANKQKKTTQIVFIERELID